ncbi:carbohydrate phosphatase [Sarocladium strictum]
MDSPYRKELEVAFGVLRQASKLSQHLVNSNDKGAVEKNDQSPVTIADFAIQALLASTLKHAFPEDTFVGEEDSSKLRQDLLLLESVWELLQWLTEDEDTAKLCTLPASRQHMCELIDQCGNSAPAKEGRTWIFDPIDGTKAFMSGHLYAINIGFLADGEQTLSAIGCPNLSINAKAPLRNEDVDPEGKGCIVYAVKGHGAYVRPIHNEDATLRRLAINTVAKVEDLRFVSCLDNVNSALPGIHDDIYQRLGAPAPTCDVIAWVLRWVSLAMGLSSATVWIYKDRKRCGKVWDHAGAMLTFEEAGGVIRCALGKKIDLKSGRLMDQNFGFVAGPDGEVFDQLLATTRKAIEEAGHGEWLEKTS